MRKRKSACAPVTGARVQLCTVYSWNNGFLIVYYGTIFLHSFIARSTAAFRNRPPDIVERTFPLAGLAVQAVGWIGRLYIIADGLIYSRRAERNAGTVEYQRASGPANLRVQNRQV